MVNCTECFKLIGYAECDETSIYKKCIVCDKHFLTEVWFTIAVWQTMVKCYKPAIISMIMHLNSKSNLECDKPIGMW